MEKITFYFSSSMSISFREGGLEAKSIYPATCGAVSAIIIMHHNKEPYSTLVLAKIVLTGLLVVPFSLETAIASVPQIHLLRPHNRIADHNGPHGWRKYPCVGW